MDKFSERLKYLRKNKNLLQKEVAYALNIPTSTLGSWESGIRKPELDTAKIIADYYNVSMDYLIGRSDIKNFSSINISKAHSEYL